MKCLLKYQWVKLPRMSLPQGKGILGFWARLASRAAFRKGQAQYCGHLNEVVPGMWAGGIVGLKSILGTKSRAEALRIMDTLKALGYIDYSLDLETKKLSYTIKDWIVKCSEIACIDRAVYATEGYGFLCLPRSIPQRLAEQSIRFEEADAWLDLWCHTTWQDPCNAFSFLAPAVQYRSCGAALTLETLGQRWGWEKTKVWRFFKKHGDTFALYRLPGSFGCLVFNLNYPSENKCPKPSQNQIVRILNEIRILGKNTHFHGDEHERLNRMILRFSREICSAFSEKAMLENEKCRVSLFTPITRAYFSLCWNWKNYGKDCRGIRLAQIDHDERIRGPCAQILK